MSLLPHWEPSAAEKKAGVVRDNAFRDLADVMRKLMRQMLALTKGEVLGPGDPGKGTSAQRLEIMLPVAPAQVHNLIETGQVTQKQLEIAINSLVEILVRKGHLDMTQFLELCTEHAEETGRVMNRGLLSAGLVGPAPGAIIKRN